MSISLLLASLGQVSDVGSARADRGDNLPEPIKNTFIKKVPKEILDARRLRRLEDAVEVFSDLDDFLELEQFEDAKMLLRDPKVKYLRGNLREANKDFVCTEGESSQCMSFGDDEKLIGAIERFDGDLKKIIKNEAGAPTVEDLRNQATSLNSELQRITNIVRERTPKNVPEEFIGNAPAEGTKAKQTM
eukprot:CAMPEP_0184480858 /NCGR_PEP_ID=MMETSP0113_2-20130426/2365_1 /TAXON_ID=91329 /ORGANISM="Norrisiella sphaerica, Strain BC52" /LENGTH=188 /DNA_ID=CAMNT_0026859617 /DNA_START=312 /DNA_END=878 /DNA_ORIENTATION=+